jgi:hypothetical protein
MRDFTQTTAGCRSTPPRCAAARAGLAAAADPGRLRRARHPRRVALARPGGRGGLAATSRGCARTAWNSRATAAAACSPTPTPPAARPRATTTGARWTRPASWARPAWCWWSAACPARWPAARRTRTSPARARRSPKASPRCWRTRASAACRWPSSRCTRCTPPTAPASTRWSRRWTSATRSTRRAAARWAWRWTSTTCGGTRSCSSRSSAPAASGCWPSTSATGSCPPPTC